LELHLPWEMEKQYLSKTLCLSHPSTVVIAQHCAAASLQCLHSLCTGSRGWTQS
jgi:hypothetical protein